MSYCRWSSDDFQCDVYVYGDVSGGFTTHIANRRYVFDKPLPPEVPIEDTVKFLERTNAIMQMLDHEKMVPIEHPEAGKSYNDPDARTCAVRLIKLKEQGLRVPQYAIDELIEEANETDNPKTPAK